jgi:hypothetical protein
MVNIYGIRIIMSIVIITVMNVIINYNIYNILLLYYIFIINNICLYTHDIYYGPI